MLVTNQLIYLEQDPFGFWGSLYGSFTALTSFGLALWLLPRARPSSRRWGRYIAAGTLILFGLMVVAWIVAWGFTPFTLEGMWIYPLATVPLVGAWLILRRKRPKEKQTLDLYR